MEKKPSSKLIVLPQRYSYLIGIDTGVVTGYAIYDAGSRQLLQVKSLMIHQAIEAIIDWAQFRDTLIRVEDARQAVYGRQLDAHRLRGAGSVMRDAKIWEDFLTDHGARFEMLRPRKEFTKLPADVFQRITGYKAPTNQHGRDAAMLVYGY